MDTSNADGWPAPAKLNLFLHITGRRDDGYHLLQTLFQFVDYGDTLTFHLREDGVVSRRSALAGVPPETDLVVRAARALQGHCNAALGVDIEVDKHLPMGGGLGGGSSDAATTLVALNHLWGCGLDQDQLAELGIGLGADVPVFVRGLAAWAEGVGEKLQPVSVPEPWYLVVTPPVAVATATVFGASELTRDCPPITIRDFLSGEGRNVCEPVVRANYPEVDNAMRWLAKYGEPLMTGTGACIFVAFEQQQQARAVLDQLPAGLNGFVAKGANRSPLLDRLETA